MPSLLPLKMTSTGLLLPLLLLALARMKDIEVGLVLGSEPPGNSAATSDLWCLNRTPVKCIEGRERLYGSGKRSGHQHPHDPHKSALTLDRL